jgi:OmpA-OmpF porin, OOP family
MNQTSLLLVHLRATQLAMATTVVMAGGLIPSAQAQSSYPIVPPGQTSTAYVLDSSNAIVHNNFGECVRTGFWTVAGAMATKVVGSAFSAGCACDKPLMPAGRCVPPPLPVAMPGQAPAPVAPVPVLDKIAIPTDALFGFDRATLSPQGQDKLNDYMVKLETLNLEAVVAVGHTDRIGTLDYNLNLSQERAQAIKTFLVSKGIPAERVFTEGRGETQAVTGDQCQGIKGPESGANKALVQCLAPDRRVMIEAIGSRR